MESNVVHIARNVAVSTDYPKVKEILNQFLESCPSCGQGRGAWRIDTNNIIPPIREKIGYDLVRYRCRCGKRFKKVELTDDDNSCA